MEPLGCCMGKNLGHEALRAEGEICRVLYDLWPCCSRLQVSFKLGSYGHRLCGSFLLLHQQWCFRGLPLNRLSGGAEVSPLPGRGRSFLESYCLFCPQPTWALSSHLFPVEMILCLGGPPLVLWALDPSPTPATTPCHMVFLPPTSLGLALDSFSQVAVSVSCSVSHTSRLTCSASACVPGARTLCS